MERVSSPIEVDVLADPFLKTSKIIEAKSTEYQMSVPNKNRKVQPSLFFGGMHWAKVES